MAAKIDRKRSQLLAEKLIEMLSTIPESHRKSITLDRGSEFAKHALVTDALDQLPFYFADPHSPWQRGTNENTNGLLREYFPKSFEKIQLVGFSDQLNFKTSYYFFIHSPTHKPISYVYATQPP